ncbi:bacteriohemerythrin [Clostridium sp. C2-6-12]|uniref:bacteriohemerythrin n=1 Tax=Clostridium sp. C2-6-12 TaxID=2698832 RepID=UPI0013717AD0|nr:bacteriohemerythrin [Clostridium sp. C2-6-12]
MGMNWDNNLSTGINSIDNQHKELFDRINQLLSAMKEGKAKDEIMKTLDFLEEYVIKHFTEEEMIQRKNNYPKYNMQHEQHEQFKSELKKLRETFDSKGTSALLVLNVQKEMSNWWRSHITGMDKDLGQFLMTNNK